MATAQRTVDYITDQIATAGVVRSRKMFGEYAVYCDEKVVALVCDDTLFVKITPEGRAYLMDPVEGAPYPGAKPYFIIPDERLDDREWMAGLVRVTCAALPIVRPRSRRAGRSN